MIVPRKILTFYLWCTRFFFANANDNAAEEEEEATVSTSAVFEGIA